MKGLKISFIILTAALLTFGLSGMASAFHSGGVAECVGCHSMHEAAGGALLIEADASSTCLVCHGRSGASSYHIATPSADMPDGTPPGNRTPGGDFGWIAKTYTWIPRGTTVSVEEGDSHGHNVVATTYDSGYLRADATLATAPGGTFDSADLSCTSCHDQHSKYRRIDTGVVLTGAPIIASGSYNNSPTPTATEAVGVYRLLRGVGNQAKDALGNDLTAFTEIPPAAVAPSTYNRTEASTATRVAYGAGMSKFCAGCHPDMHVDSGNLVHRVDQELGTVVAATYNAYVGTGDLGGDVTTSYDSIVPFQTDNSRDYTALAALAVNDGSVTTGPASTDRVTCVSCHRAHASGFEFMSRWNNEIEMIVINGEWPGTDAVSAEAQAPKWAMGRTAAETAKAYNDKPATSYATYQRVLCNKCHAKD